MPMLVKFYQSYPENPENPDSNKLELKCVTSVNKTKKNISFFGKFQYTWHRDNANALVKRFPLLKNVGEEELFKYQKTQLMTVNNIHYTANG